MKKLMYLLFAVSLFTACCNNTKTNSTDCKESAKCEGEKPCADKKSAKCKGEKPCADKESCKTMDVDSFLVVAQNLVGEQVTVNGTVDHVCKHGGKKVKIFSSDHEKMITGTASEEVGAFDAEIQGNKIYLTGTVTEMKMELADIEKYEARVKKAIEEQAKEVKEVAKEENHGEAGCDGKEKNYDYSKTLEKINTWKEELKTSDKGYVVANYYLKNATFKNCKVEE